MRTAGMLRNRTGGPPPPARQVCAKTRNTRSAGVMGPSRGMLAHSNKPLARYSKTMQDATDMSGSHKGKVKSRSSAILWRIRDQSFTARHAAIQWSASERSRRHLKSKYSSSSANGAARGFTKRNCHHPMPNDLTARFFAHSVSRH
jgi:hypothetical protein